MLISVIIPTLNEEGNLAVALRQLAGRPDVELIIIDGGSSDHTVEVAQRSTPYVFHARAGRAQRMNLGARHATGDILLFLHADTFLLPGALDEIQRRIISDGAVGGAFDLHIDSRRHLCEVRRPGCQSPVALAAAAVRRPGDLRVAAGFRGAGRFSRYPDHGRHFVHAAVATGGAADASFVPGWSPAGGAGTPTGRCAPRW